MPTVLVADCPRCRSRQMTFDALSAIPTGEIRYNWQRWYEVFCLCRNCMKATVFVLAQENYELRQYLSDHSPTEIKGSLNNHFSVDGYICLKDMGAAEPPEHVPELVANAFHEGAVSVAVGIWNAAGAMFRLAIDLTTRPMLPEGNVQGLNSKTRRDLGLRLPWLFDNGKLPSDLRDLSSCVREDGNDGVHAGTLTKEDAQDLLDFTTALLERIYTEPERLRLAKERRDKRRAQKDEAEEQRAEAASDTS